MSIEEVVAIGKEAGVPPSITKALMWEESRGFVKAKSKMVKGYRSLGLYQLYSNPSNLHELLNKFWYPRLDGFVGERWAFDIWNPRDNAKVGLRYLSALRRQYGSWYNALLFYNAGTIKKAPKSTRDYARRITNAKQ